MYNDSMWSHFISPIFVPIYIISLLSEFYLFHAYSARVTSQPIFPWCGVHTHVHTRHIYCTTHRFKAVIISLLWHEKLQFATASNNYDQRQLHGYLSKHSNILSSSFFSADRIYGRFQMLSAKNESASMHIMLHVSPYSHFSKCKTPIFAISIYTWQHLNSICLSWEISHFSREREKTKSSRCSI